MIATRSLLVAVLALPTAPVGADPQPFLLHGTVTTRGAGQAVEGASVSVPELGLEASTDAQGQFSLSLPAEQAGRALSVRVRAAGLAPVTRSLRLEAGSSRASTSSCSPASPRWWWWARGPREPRPRRPCRWTS